MRRQRGRQRVDWHDSPSQNTRARRSCLSSESQSQMCSSSTQPWSWLSATQGVRSAATQRFSDRSIGTPTIGDDSIVNDNAKFSDEQRKVIVLQKTPPLLRRRHVKVRKSQKVSPLVSHCALSSVTSQLPHRSHLSFSPLLAGKCIQSMSTEQCAMQRAQRSSIDSAVDLSPLSPFSSLDLSSETSPPSPVTTWPTVSCAKTSTQVVGKEGTELFSAPSPIPMRMQNGRRRTSASPLVVASTPKRARPSDEPRKADAENSMDDSALNELLRAVKTPVGSGELALKTPLRRSHTFDIGSKKQQPRQLVKVGSFEYASSADKQDSWDDDSLLADPHFLAQLDAIDCRAAVKKVN